MEKLLEIPDEDGYSVAENPKAIAYQALDGGRGRSRLDVLSGSRFVTAQWSGSHKRFKTVRDFFDLNLALNNPPFLLDLVIDTADSLEYVCQVVSDSIQSSQPKSFTFSITAKLEVHPRTDQLNSWPIYEDA